MSFHAKSTALALAAYTVVTIGYVVLLVRAAADTPVEDVDYHGLLIGLVVVFVVIAIVGNIALAGSNIAEADAIDERDRIIELKGERVGGWVLAAGALGALALAMTDQATFWIAQTILAGLVLGEIASSTSQLVMYRRGA